MDVIIANEKIHYFLATLAFFGAAAFLAAVFLAAAGLAVAAFLVVVFLVVVALAGVFLVTFFGAAVAEGFFAGFLTSFFALVSLIAVAFLFNLTGPEGPFG